MRYRMPQSHNGTTRMNLQKLRKHFGRLGKIATVSGYKVLCRYSVNNISWVNVEPRVMVTDVNGNKLRLNGILWGYMGEGPRGTVDLLEMCGMNRGKAMKIVENQPNNYYSMTTRGRKFERIFTIDFRKQTLTTAL